MNNIANAFKNGKAFIAFVTAGDPSPEKTVEYILEMEKAGADLIELGIPFSDPTAEGPVIQAANMRALRGGTTTDTVFGIMAALREKSRIPVVLLTYLNPVFHYGYEAFFSRCEEVGVDGIIVPDMPYEEKGEIVPFAAAHHVSVIPLIAPTSEQRIQMIAKDADGFIYVVSSMGVTGVREEIKTDIASIVQAIRAVTDVPAAVGFGISTPEQAQQIARVSDGVIVGSAIVKIIGEYGDNAAQPLAAYVRSMKEAAARAGS